MQQAPYLQPSDTVHIISTARKISNKEIKPSMDLLTSWGLKVVLGENLFQEQHQFAGNREQRTKDLQTALDDPSCKAILCARGGYGTVQLIDNLDFTDFLQSPKWIIGYSDVTALHSHINENFGIESLHATMCINLPNGVSAAAIESLRKALFGEIVSLDFQLEEESTPPLENVTAPLVGGNLSILYSLTGTPSQIDTKGKFLFLEDLDEYLYHIDRMLMNLSRVGMLSHCKGLLVGGMSDMNDNAIPYGQTAKEIILQHANAHQIPVIFGVPAGHIQDNRCLIMNRMVELTVDGSSAKLQFHGRT